MSTDTTAAFAGTALVTMTALLHDAVVPRVHGTEVVTLTSSVRPGGSTVSHKLVFRPAASAAPLLTSTSR